MADWLEFSINKRTHIKFEFLLASSVTFLANEIWNGLSIAIER